METVRSSVLCAPLLPLFAPLSRSYQASLLCRLLARLSAFCRRLWQGSRVAGFLSREGVLSRAWSSSALCRWGTIALNLPAALLHLVYRKLRPVFDSSFAARLGFGMGEQTPAAISWLFLLLTLIPYQHWDNRYSLIAFVLAGLLMLAGGMRRRTLRFDLASAGPYLVCFAGAVLLAFPLSAFPGLSFRFLFFHVTCMLCVLITVSTVEQPRDLLRLATFACLALALMSAVGIAQRIIGVEVNPSYVDLMLNEGIPGRVYAMYDNPNAFAQVLALLIPLSAGLCLGSPGWLGRMVGAGSALLGLAAILMTYGRASWIGLGIAALLFVLLWNPKLLPVIVLLGVAALPLLPDTIFNRILTIFNLQDTSTSSRFSLFSAALRLLALRPIPGAGLGTDAVRQAVKDLNLYHGVAPFVHAHNVYLQVWAETGLLGILSFLAAMGWTIKQAIQAVAGKASPASVRLITIGGASALTGILVCGLADYIWNYPRVMLIFWFTAAVTLAGIRLLRRATPA